MDHAVVIGASIAGLLSAAALHRRFAQVTVLDRDTLPAVDAHRRGAGQSRHAHGLLARGSEVMDELLPGLSAELVAQGAIRGDMQDRARHVHAGRRLARGSSGLTGLLVSRPLLEGQVRRRVGALPGVRVLAERTVTGLLARQGRVTGVRLAEGELIPADLVVDAAGRGSRTPFWLGDLGFRPPREERVTIDLRYSSREFRRRDDHLAGDVIAVVGPTPGTPRAGVALALEDERWVVTLAGYGMGPPRGHGDFAAFAATLAAPDLHHLVTTAEPLGEPRTYHTPTAVRRRYERLASFPDGLLVTGDAVCSFNPLYGQGMTVAALEAKALLDPGLSPAAYFRRLAAIVDLPWEITVGADLRIATTDGRPTPKMRLIGAYLDRFHAAAAHDPELTRRFLRVTNLYDPPQSLMSPPALLRVLRSGAQRAVPVPA
ncbi:2-polyprenyl-6-methoxyphenol hydroxylase-like FAD-dependent oxidoreductase [Nonomuraea thailandensis]|uniref:2-polyprenyl-6-methoxyphenol hydroxylase-like FAD-dependent oxidoreductase n=1 Tax=Nonomuraea thailandensis TaxID=1188745 RepID=A0A9X2GJC1_9ACTN|nr:FAD-dependent monooxygenase [Nonomuraea thailandensis]MCP2359931.1 2-polyprenyl-6-methoxyphenol hydroxylase-like FAD-dependent oxidoreductase [Nonomuraea thailandensis]